MQARFNSTCPKCGHGIKKGDSIEIREGKGIHTECLDSSTQDDQEALAERLGFSKHDELLELLRRGMPTV